MSAAAAARCPDSGFWAEVGITPCGPTRRCPRGRISTGSPRGHPAILSRVDGHIAVANSAAFALSGVTNQTPNPQGSQLDHDAQGDLTGIVREDSAQDLIRAAHPAPSP